MKKVKVTLKDASGGLNDTAHPSGIAQNELPVLENYYTDEEGTYLMARGGKELMQYAPIDPQPFVADADTVALYTLDDGNGSAAPADTSGNGYDLDIGYAGLSAIAGLFPIGAGVGIKMTDNLQSGGNGSYLCTSAIPSVLNNQPEVTFESWVWIPTTFTGAAPSISRGGTFRDTPIHSGACIVGVSALSLGAPFAVEQGITIHRDYDDVAGKEASDCYFKFTLKTNGIPGTETILQSLYVPFARWLHVKGTYSQTTGKMKLFVNGALHREATPNGGGVVYSAAETVAIGSSYQYSYAPFSHVYTVFPGYLDEVRISTVERTTVPYKEPRGKGFWLAKSNGTQQFIVAADGGLYYTVGNAEWTTIATGFSETAYWDAVQVKDILYLTNGTDAPKAWDGTTLLEWGNPANPPVATPGTGAGAIASGDRNFVYTYLYGDYETGPSPAAAVSNPTGLPINIFNIPPRHSNCTSVRVYATKAGGSTYYLWREISHTVNADMEVSGPWAAGTPAGYTTDTGGFGVADAALGTAVYPTMDAAVANSETKKWKYLLAEHSRVFGCGNDDEPYTLRWSELGAIDCFRAFSFTNADAKRGALIALASFYGEIHASKNGEATLILRGDNPQNWVQLETLHPTIGCIDHWAYVHHYDVNSDKYVLCFPARDGFYAYAGQAIQKISDKIDGTTDRLAQIVANRVDWLTTTQAQFMSNLANGGSADNNIQQIRYETDGLREEPGKLKMINQRDYLGLWSDSAPLVPGHPTIIAVEKGEGEGVFYFATADSTSLYRTDDNFVTYVDLDAIYGPTTVGNNGTDERIIQIVRAGGADIYYLITDTSGVANTYGTSSAGGRVHIWDATGLAFTTLNASILYYDLDVPNRMRGNFQDPNRLIGQTPYGAFNGSSVNIFINHAQTVAMQSAFYGPNTLPSGFTAAPKWLRALWSNVASINGGWSSAVFQATIQFLGSLGPFIDSIAVAPGFFSCGHLRLNNSPANSTRLRLDYTRREFPRWLGGTFSPQAFWDDANSRLVFLASSAEDANQNRTTSIYTLALDGTLGTYTISGKQVAAITAAGSQLLMWTLNRATDDSNNASYCFGGRIEKSTLAAPGTVTATATDQVNFFAIRLAYNSQNSQRYVALCKSFEGGLSGQDFYTYTASIRSIATATSAPSTLLAMTADGDSGAIPLEVAVQTTTPYSWVVAMNKLTSVALYTVSLQALSQPDVSALKTSPYLGLDAGDSATGIRSNLLFVAASGQIGNWLWADRVYWYSDADTAADRRMLQLGLLGNWRVDGGYVGPYNNLGALDGLDALDSDFQGSITYYLRNAADTAGLAANEQLIQPNSKLGSTLFNPITAYAQWRVAMTWVSTATATPDAPYINFVTLGYYLGADSLPRVIGTHYRSRSYWAVAEDTTEENNIVLVWQKSKTWTKLKGWRLKGMSLFRNELVGIEDYQLVRLESGDTDMGNLVVGKARTGYSLGYVDKLISGVQANVKAVVNNSFPDKGGFVILTPYRGDEALTDSRWVLPLPAATTKEPRRVKGTPYDGFGYDWARSWALEIATSEDTSGDFVPVIGQREVIQQIDLTMDVTGETYDIPVE